MTTTPAEGTATLSADVAAEIRAWMGRLGITQAELARRLGQNSQWISVRISAKATVALNLDEIQRVADALGVLVKDLLPAYAFERKASTSSDMATTRYRAPAERTSADAALPRTAESRLTRPPKRRPRAATSPGPASAKLSTRRPGMIPRPVGA